MRNAYNKLVGKLQGKIPLVRPRHRWKDYITRGYPKVSGLVDRELNNKHSLRSNTKDYGGKTHYTDSQNSDTSASSGRELYHL
jgi:hypothetical protein